jgi:hypothetical protein
VKIQKEEQRMKKRAKKKEKEQERNQDKEVKKETYSSPYEAAREAGLHSKKDYSNVKENEKEDPFGVPSWAKKYHTYGSSGVK